MMNLNTFTLQPQQGSFQADFGARAQSVNEMIDAKCRFVMRSARLQAVANSRPEVSLRCLTLVDVLERRITHLQNRIDRELRGLLYSVDKAPSPSTFVDYLPG